MQETLAAEMVVLAPRLLPSAPEELKAAFVLLDPETGAVLAYIGSRNAGDEYSCATVAKREPGSTVKTLELAAALEARSVDLHTSVNDDLWSRAPFRACPPTASAGPEMPMETSSAGSPSGKRLPAVATRFL